MKVRELLGQLEGVDPDTDVEVRINSHYTYGGFSEEIGPYDADWAGLTCRTIGVATANPALYYAFLIEA